MKRFSPISMVRAIESNPSSSPICELDLSLNRLESPSWSVLVIPVGSCRGGHVNLGRPDGGGLSAEAALSLLKSQRLRQCAEVASPQCLSARAAICGDPLLVRAKAVLGVSVVERPLFVAAFAPVAEVPLACCPLTSLWLSFRCVWSLRSIPLAVVGRARCGVLCYPHRRRRCLTTGLFCGVYRARLWVGHATVRDRLSSCVPSDLGSLQLRIIVTCWMLSCPGHPPC